MANIRCSCHYCDNYEGYLLVIKRIDNTFYVITLSATIANCLQVNTARIRKVAERAEDSEEPLRNFVETEC